METRGAEVKSKVEILSSMEGPCATCPIRLGLAFPKMGLKTCAQTT